MNLDQELIRRIALLEKQLDDLVKPEVGWTPTFLTTPYTITDFDGDSFSTVAVNTKIENSDWSTTIPTTAKALIIRLEAADSGSAANNCWFGLYPTAAGATLAMRAIPYGKPNDARAAAHAVVPCTDGDIWYQCLASGAGTLDVWMWCWGYWT